MLYLYKLRNSRFNKLLFLFFITFIYSATVGLAQESNLKEKLKHNNLSEVQEEQLLPSSQKITGGSVDVPQQDHERHMTPRNTGSNEISDPNIEQVYEDSQGRMYALSTGAVDINDGGNESHWDLGEELPGNPLQIMEDDQNRIWVATSAGLVQFDADLNKENTITNDNSDLKRNLIQTMALADNGNIWLGHRHITTSRDSLNHPDTASFAGGISVYNPSQGEVTAIRDTGMVQGPVSDIHVRENGDIWASVAPGDQYTDEGIYVYRPSEDSAWTYTESNSGIPQNQISSIAEDSEGTMWVGFSTSDQYGRYTMADDTLSGAARFDGSEWTDHSHANTELSGSCLALGVDTQDNIYYGNYDTTMVYDGSGWSAFTGGNDRFPLDGMTSMIINSNGNKVFSTITGGDLTGGGVHTDASDNWEFVSTQTDNGLFSTTIFGLTVDNQGRIWASGFHGVGYMENGEWTYFNANDGLASTYVWKIFAASDGTIWMGNSKNGVTRFSNGNLEVYDEYGPFVESIFEDSNENLWMGSFSGDQPGVLQFDGNQYTYHDTMENVIGENVISIGEGPDGNILASTEVGIAEYDGSEWTKWLPEDNSFRYSEIESDADRNIWIPTRDSLVKWDGSSLTSYIPPESFGYVNHSEAGPEGSLWLNTLRSTEDDQYKTYIYDNEGWSSVNTSRRPYVTAHDSSGSTWIGTFRGGLYKFNRQNAVAVEEARSVPDRFSLGDNYPNPFNPSTKISFSLPSQSHVELTVFDMLGREVTTLVDESRQAGSHQVDFDASNLASGVYMYRIEAASFTQTKKMILLK